MWGYQKNQKSHVAFSDYVVVGSIPQKASVFQLSHDVDIKKMWKNFIIT